MPNTGGGGRENMRYVCAHTKSRVTMSQMSCEQTKGASRISSAHRNLPLFARGRTCKSFIYRIPPMHPLCDTLGLTTGPTEAAGWPQRALGGTRFLRVFTRFSAVNVLLMLLHLQVTAMARVTRSGTTFSPFEFDPRDFGPALQHIQVFRSRVSLTPHIQEAIRLADLHAAMLDNMEEGCIENDDGWEDEELVLSRPPTPLSRPLTPLSPSPLYPEPLPPPPSCPPSPFSRSPTPLSHDSRSSSPLLEPPLDPPVPSYKRRAAEGKRSRRRRARVAKAQAARFGPPPKAKHSQVHRELPAYETTFNATDLPSSSTAWMGPHPSKKARASRTRARGLKELLDDDNDLVEWEGKYALLLFFLCFKLNDLQTSNAHT